MNRLAFTAEIQSPMQLEAFLRREKQVSHRMLVRCKRQGHITRNGSPIRTIDLVFPGDEILLELPETEGTAVPNPALKVPILYKSPHILVYNKPPDMPCHPSHGHYTANVFAASHPNTPFRCINRLDRNTSGACIAARTAYGASFIQQKAEKTYLAAVTGILTESGTICAPIGRASDSVIRRCVCRDGKPALTHYTPLYGNEQYTLVQFRLETGRTHQIRVHMAYIGHPLAGDDLYGQPSEGISRHGLHCSAVRFPEPETGASVTISAPLPRDIAALFPERKIFSSGFHTDY
ncbi:MAG: RluA family pseudouridine synthase [Ruminococcus sp.]